MPPAIIPEKAIILHTLEDAGMYGSMYVVMYLCLHVRMDGWLYGWMDVFMSFMYLCIVTIPPTKKKTPISKWRCMHTYHTSFMN